MALTMVCFCRLHRTVLRPPNPANFSNLWVVLNMCKWDLGKVSFAAAVWLHTA